MLNSQASKLIDVAKGYVGYLEKETNKDLEKFKDNVGDKNYTAFGAWYPMQGQPWCASFVSYCASKAQIPTSIIPKHASCSVGVAWFKKEGRWHNRDGYTPQTGDIVYFSHNGVNPVHVGIVYSVDKTKVFTIEGNTSNASELVENGGAVAIKSYLLNSAKILGYGNPNYVVDVTDDTAQFKAIIKSKCNLSDDTFKYLDGYQYSKELYKKWAESYK